MEFEQACSEMNYILEHLNPVDKKKIPEAVINFFKENKSIFYKPELDVTKKLSEQNLKDETKAFIEILDKKYFNGVHSEQNSENLNNQELNYIQEKQNTCCTDIIIRKKENRIIEWFKKIFRIKHR